LEFSLIQKKDMFLYNLFATKKFIYDFIRLAEKNFDCEPFSFLIRRALILNLSTPVRKDHYSALY
tara:strand:- start:5253 stop:5447 length:195 start_codon:yes stop_codon:yes gene_type:complete